MNDIIDYLFEDFFTTMCIIISMIIVFSYFFNLISEFFEEGTKKKVIRNLIDFEYHYIPYVITIFLTISVIYYHGILKILYLSPIYLYVLYRYIKNHK